MARIRTIKPDFFVHEGLAELSRDARLLFIGLWTMADREGRLDDRPKRIKAVIFPYDDDTQIPAWLDELADRGFILRYEADGQKRIAIVKFSEHQRPHPKETPSLIPPPPGAHRTHEAEASREKVSPSREITRLDGEPSGTSREKVGSFPSSPAGKEILDNGNEILEGGKETRPMVAIGPDVLTIQGIQTRLAEAVQRHHPEAGFYRAGRFADRALRDLLDGFPAGNDDAKRTDILTRIEAFAASRDPWVESQGWSVAAFIDRWSDPDGSKRKLASMSPREQVVAMRPKPFYRQLKDCE